MRLAIGSAMILVAAATGLWLANLPTRAASPGDPGAGRDIAARWCAGCHVVAPSGAGNNNAPSFMTIARTRSPAQIQAFLVHPHGAPLQGIALSGREIQDVTAYIVTLRAHPRPGAAGRK